CLRGVSASETWIWSNAAKISVLPADLIRRQLAASAGADAVLHQTRGSSPREAPVGGAALPPLAVLPPGRWYRGRYESDSPMTIPFFDGHNDTLLRLLEAPEADKTRLFVEGGR